MWFGPRKTPAKSTAGSSADLMTTEFVLKLDLSGHEHHQMAQHAHVCQMLDLAKQAIGSDSKRHGELTIPRFDVSLGVNRPAVIGSWAFNQTER
jgi:hypothetical protein